MIFKTKDFRKILADVLALRQSRNKSYSLRAFARDLKISPSHLSGIMSGSEGLSLASAEAFAPFLGLNEKEQDFFLALVTKSCSKNTKLQADAEIKIKKILSDIESFELNPSMFVLISKWYYFAILELLKLKSFNPSDSNISKSLGISLQETRAAIKQLIDLKFIIEKDARYKLLKPKTVTSRFMPSKIQKSFHSQVIKKAEEAVFMQNFAQRSVGSLFFAVNENDLPEAFTYIESFRREFSERFGKGQDHVYCLATQIFQINDRSNVGATQ